jgi:hypothetical protein
MKFEVYCDESHPDVFSSNGCHASYLLLGSLWIPALKRDELKLKINSLKRKHQFFHEIKWHKVHKAKKNFYLDLINLFFEYGEQLRFRCIAIEGEKVNLVQFHQSDHELGYYKFYYQLLHHWILSFNEYTIFCDEKTNRLNNRIATLKTVLQNSNLSSKVLNVQALPSHQLVLLQFSDFLLGMASSRLNNTIQEGSCKDELIKQLEQRLNVEQLKPTSKSEQKFNIFKINLQGGW